jgi:hypothetical protein
MYDFVGNKLEVGDSIVYCRTFGKSKDMVKTTVLGFTENSVKVEPYTWDGEKKGYNTVAPGNTVKYVKEPKTDSLES